MLVKDLMSTSVITVSPDTLVSEIAEIIHKHHFTGVPVVNAEGRVLGTISERDFITATSGLYLPTYIKLLSSMDYVQGSKKGLPVVVNQVVTATAKDIMNQSVPFARPETTLEELASMFAIKRANPINPKSRAAIPVSEAIPIHPIVNSPFQTFSDTDSWPFQFLLRAPP